MRLPARTVRTISRLILLAGLCMIAFGAAGQLGLFVGTNLTATIGVVGLPVAGGPAVFDLLTRHATFAASAVRTEQADYVLSGPEFDSWLQGELRSRTLPEGETQAVLGLAIGEPPRARPAESAEDRYTRLPIIFVDVTGALGGNVVSQVKFLTLKIQTRWRGATGCKAEVSARLLRGEPGLLRTGTWMAVGESNWYSEQKVSDLFSPAVGHAAIDRARELRLLAQKPEFMLNRFLSNPREDIARGKWAYLPLLYMRQDSKYLYFNGSLPAAPLARVSPHSGSIELQLQVELTGQSADPDTVFARVRADWNDLSIELFEPKRRELQ